MTEFLGNMTLLDRVFLICAVIGGAVFLIRTLMQFLGADGDSDMGGMDGDLDLDGGMDSGMHVFTVQGISSFLLMFGLMGLCLHLGSNFGETMSLFGALLTGLFFLWLIAKIMHLFTRLQSSGTEDIRNAVGEKGVVYLHIPPKGTGKVQINLQGRLRVMDAISHEDVTEELKTNDHVVIVDVINSILIVKKHQTA